MPFNLYTLINLTVIIIQLKLNNQWVQCPYLYEGYQEYPEYGYHQRHHLYHPHQPYHHQHPHHYIHNYATSGARSSAPESPAPDSPQVEDFAVYDMSAVKPQSQMLIPVIPRSDSDILADLTKVSKVKSRAGEFCDSNCRSCLATCNYLKTTKAAKDGPLVQYLYLAVCSKGCKNQLDCLTDNYCLPVMQENPDYFVICANSCPLFPIIPKVFLK